MTNQEIEKMAKFEDDYWWHKGKVFLITELLESLKVKSNFHPKNCLEIGCGTGNVISKIQDRFEVFGLDFSEKAVNFCKERGLTNVEISDITQLKELPFKRKFDTVLALDVLEHLDDDVAVMKKIQEILSPDGKFIITVPAHKFLWSSHDEALNHRRRYHIQELKGKLESVGYNIELFSYYVMAPFFPILFYRAIMNIFGTGTYPKTSYVLLPKFINEFFFRLMIWEAKALGYVKLPFGVSLVAVVSLKS